MSSSRRRTADLLFDLIFAFAARFAAQKERTKTDYFRLFTSKSQCSKTKKEASLTEVRKAILMVAGAGFEPTTSGL